VNFGFPIRFSVDVCVCKVIGVASNGEPLGSLKVAFEPKSKNWMKKGNC